MVLAATSVAILVALKVFGPRLLFHKAASIHIGDTKNQVLVVLGAPTATVPSRAGTPNVSLGFPQPEDWCYGERFHWHFGLSRQFPYLVHIDDRGWSFCPWPRDTVVEFDAAGKVFRVQIPKS